MEKKPVTASLEDFASGKVRVRDMVKIKGVDEEAQTRA
jgi:DNA-directed RNA polymerase subunit K/omega